MYIFIRCYRNSEGHINEPFGSVSITMAMEHLSLDARCCAVSLCRVCQCTFFVGDTRPRKQIVESSSASYSDILSEIKD